MPAEVIDRVHTIARRSGASLGLQFTDRDGNLIITPEDDDDYDSDDDESYHPSDDDDSDDDDDNSDEDRADHVPIAGVYDQETEDEMSPLQEHADDYDSEDEDDDESTNENDANVEVEVEVTTDMPTEGQTGDVKNDPHEIEENDLQEESMDAKYGARSGIYDLRTRHPRDYSHMHATLEGKVMTQHSMKKGLKLYGEEGVNSVLDELKQLHDRKVVEPKKLLTRDEKRAALHYLMFIKQKRCGRIKARGCADGRKQREHTTKEEASSPTVAIESLMLACVIDAKEKRDVAVVDIPGAFMQVDMDEL
eukprot:scaffold126826_cov58-Attheya_sp.AAC.1